MRNEPLDEPVCARIAYGLDIIAQQQAERYYYVHDGLGSVRQLVDSTIKYPDYAYLINYNGVAVEWGLGRAPTISTPVPGRCSSTGHQRCLRSQHHAGGLRQASVHLYHWRSRCRRTVPGTTTPT
jgi:hypothetical protein